MPEGNEIKTRLTPTTIRLVSFNVNGVKTLKNYHPWTSTPTYSDMFHYMNADIVTFQELKLQRSDIDYTIADIKDYYSFISIPLSKKGYSGVGVFIRKPNDCDSELVKRALTVTKAEEGITGLLTFKKSKSSYIESIQDPEYEGFCIGGYPARHGADESMLKKVDSEGRCVIVELNFGVVLISVYCPANSMCTEEGEQYRMLFLVCLFERASNLNKMGKHVVIMGDINVSMDLIDSDEHIKLGLADGVLKKPDDFNDFEIENRQQVIDFKSSTEPRTLLNDYVFDTTGYLQVQKPSQMLYDTTRKLQGRQMKLYTVWNTFKNNRPSNIGSRIDLILATAKLNDAVNQAGIWNFLQGSDHCPVYTDFDYQGFSCVESADLSENYRNKFSWFESKSFYGLHAGKSIDAFFSRNRPIKPIIEESVEAIDKASDKRRSGDSLPYVSRKKQNRDGSRRSIDQKSISNFFFKPATSQTDSDPSDGASDISTQSQSIESSQQSNKLSAGDFKSLLLQSSSSVPSCKHNEACTLRSVKNGAEKNKGKKFWCCARTSKTTTWQLDDQEETKDSDKERGIDQFNCGFFKWASKV